LDDKQKKIEYIQWEIKRLETSKKKISSTSIQQINNTIQKFKDKNPELTIEIKSKLKTLAISYKKIKNLQEQLIELYKKSFKRLSSKRIIVQNTFNEKLPPFIIIYRKGFGFTHFKNKHANFIEDWDLIKQLFFTSELLNYLPKKEKEELFLEFGKAISNWIEMPSNRTLYEADIEIPFVIPIEDIIDEKIEDIKCLNTYRIRFDITNDWDDDEKAYRFIFFSENMEWHYYLNEDDYDFAFISIVLLWDKIRETIDDEISLTKTIIENNEMVLNELKKKIAKYIVVEEL